ncbi:MAG: xylulokinase [Planctomycetota bacterium]
MPTSPLFLGIDIDASGLCLVALDQAGQVAAQLRRAYGGRSEDGEHDPQDWWRALRTGIKEMLRRSRCAPDRIRCVGITGPADVLALLDEGGHVLCPTRFTADAGLQPYVDQLHAATGERNLANLAGGYARLGCAASRLLAIRKTSPRVWHDLHLVLPAKDFIRFRFSDNPCTDPASAGRSCLFNPRTRAWSKQILSRLQFNPAWFPAPRSGDQIAGRVSAAAAQETGLQAGTPIVTGASHRCAAAVASGVLADGDTMIELGGAGCLLRTSATSGRHPQRHLRSGCHCLDGAWTLEQDGLAAGPALDWFEQEVTPAEVQQARRHRRPVLDHLAELAAESSPAADGLFFIPPDTGRAGGFVGLRLEHRRSHLVRAVLESGALALAQALPAFQACKAPISRLIVCGPGAENALWCQIVCDALDRPLESFVETEICARGAAILASSAVGIHSDVQAACRAMVAADASYTPRSAATAAYRAALPHRTRIGEQLDVLHQPA